MPFSMRKASAEKHLFFAFLGWAVFLMFAAWILPPLDSHLQPQPLTYWCIVAIAAILAIYTAIIVPAYFYKMWRRLPSVPNKASYGLWVGFESLTFIAILTMFWSACIHSGWLAQVISEGLRFDSR
jgi:magnesium-transporting ATPase (P-type)